MSKQKADNSKNANKSQMNNGKESGIKKKYNQKIFRDWCKSCGICNAFCPKSVFSTDDMGNPVIEHPDNCIGCRFCEQHCPDFAITINERNDEDRRGQ